MNAFVAISVLCLLWVSPFVSGHGRLMEPPGRSSIWRFASDPAIAPYMDINEANYNDNELFCGGAGHQKALGGKCGVCGDAWDAKVKENEAGGKYAKGIIVRQYGPESEIDVTIELTAHHKGYFEFRLCPWNNPTVPITHECLNQYLLGTPVDSKWMLPDSGGGNVQEYKITVRLPDGVECDQCVLQWRYHTGNTWGCEEDGTCCTGCGFQEEFYGCADIAIGTGPTLSPPNYQGSSAATTTTKASSPTTPPSTTTTTTTVALTMQTTTKQIDPDNPCPGAGSRYHAYDCDSYYYCNGAQQIVQDCPPGTIFDDNRDLCDYSYNVSPPCGTKA